MTIPGWATVGSQLQVHDTQFILVLLFTYYCIICCTNNRKWTFGHPCTYFPSVASTEHTAGQNFFVQGWVFYYVQFLDLGSSKKPPIEIIVNTCECGGNAESQAVAQWGEKPCSLLVRTPLPGCSPRRLPLGPPIKQLQTRDRAWFWPWYINTGFQSLLLITDFVLLDFFSRGLAVPKPKGEWKIMLGLFLILFF